MGARDFDGPSSSWNDLVGLSWGPSIEEASAVRERQFPCECGHSWETHYSGRTCMSGAAWVVSGDVRKLRCQCQTYISARMAGVARAIDAMRQSSESLTKDEAFDRVTQALLGPLRAEFDSGEPIQPIPPIIEPSPVPAPDKRARREIGRAHV